MHLENSCLSNRLERGSSTLSGALLGAALVALGPAGYTADGFTQVEG